MVVTSERKVCNHAATSVEGPAPRGYYAKGKNNSLALMAISGELLRSAYPPWLEFSEPINATEGPLRTRLVT